MPVDESQIKWRRFISGDDDAYTWLYCTFVQVLYRYGLRFTSDIELVKDCIQEVFTHLYKHRNTLSVPDNIKVYLYVTLKNNLLRALYKDVAHERQAIEQMPFLLERTVEEDFIDKEQSQNQQKKVEEVLSLLTPRQKEIIYYRFIQGLAMDEICLLMNLNYQSAQNLIQRSLRKIRQHYRFSDLYVCFAYLLAEYAS